MGTPVPRKFANLQQSGPVTSYFLPPDQIAALLSHKDQSKGIEILSESIHFEVPLILGDTPSIYSLEGGNGSISLDLPDDLDFDLVMQHIVFCKQLLPGFIGTWKGEAIARRLALMTW